MADVTNKYGSNTALTVTNLQSLADGAWWQSAVIDNSTIKATWFELFITIVTTTTAATSVGRVKVCIAGSTDGGTDFAGGASGSEGTYTVVGNSDKQLREVDSCSIDATETTARTYKRHISVFGVPEKFSILLKDETGQALGASGNSVEIRLNGQSVA